MILPKILRHTNWDYWEQLKFSTRLGPKLSLESSLDGKYELWVLPSLSGAVNVQWASLKHFKHGSSCRRAAEEDAATQPALQPLLHGSPHPLLCPRLPALRQLRHPADCFEYARLHTHSSSSADIPQSPGDFIFGDNFSIALEQGDMCKHSKTYFVLWRPSRP